MAVGRHIAPGDVIAGYEVEELVGRGGTGEIYRALDPRLERRVALKLLAESYTEDAGFRERLLRESRIAASLDHPNVVPVYEAGETDDRLFIAMRFVEGSDLQALLRSEGPLEPSRAVAIASQVADALDAAHARGLVHRDVKPSNVLLDRQDRREHVYLADFGLTQSVTDRGPTDGHLVGTVDYVAPEQVRGDDVDGRADVYGLGCMLFEALTGTVPFSGVSDVAVIYAHLEAAPPRASERRSTLPDTLDDVLARAMAKDPDGAPGDVSGAGRRGPRRASGSIHGPARLACSSPRCSRSRDRARRSCARRSPRRSATTPPPRRRAARSSASTERAATVLSTTPIARRRRRTSPSRAARSGSPRRTRSGASTPRSARRVKVEAVGYVHDLVGLDGKVYVARDGEKLLEGFVVPYDARNGTTGRRRLDPRLQHDGLAGARVVGGRVPERPAARGSSPTGSRRAVS